MIYIKKGQRLFEDTGLVVYSPTGYYNDGDIVLCATHFNPEESVCGYEAKFIAYGGVVYSISNPEELLEQIKKIDPETLFGKDSQQVAVDKAVENIVPQNADTDVKAEVEDEEEAEGTKEEATTTPPEEIIPEINTSSSTSPTTTSSDEIIPPADADTSTTTPTTTPPEELIPVIENSTTTTPIENPLINTSTQTPEILIPTTTPPEELIPVIENSTTTGAEISKKSKLGKLFSKSKTKTAKKIIT